MPQIRPMCFKQNVTVLRVFFYVSWLISKDFFVFWLISMDFFGFLVDVACIFNIPEHLSKFNECTFMPQKESYLRKLLKRIRRTPLGP